jgi:hypothetical protein
MPDASGRKPVAGNGNKAGAVVAENAMPDAWPRW